MVHVGLAGIIQLLMLVTTPTKLYPVIPSQALFGGLFAFYLVDQISQVFILGGIDCRGVGNRYHCHALIWFQPSPTELFEMLPQGDKVSA